METKEKNNGQVKQANSVKTDKKEPQFVAGNPVNTVSKKAEEQTEPTKPEADKSGFVNVNEQVQSKQAETPKPQEDKKDEPTKKEIKANFEQEKPAPNLEQTLRKIKDLHRLSNQREKLLETIETLDAFEVAQLDDAEETNLNHFQGCTLTIKDDTGRVFTTKNPFIIVQTAKNINTLCVDKLTEVEGQISLTL
ncbi:hypothetical protein AAKU52_003483 [Pedobacter sp. CG_S7]|uniref:hypothetical protein n=1 Tax=Pedobacter sp. CG_S7 TaxID=3143930 RepID=UPI0033939AF0